MEVVFKAGLRGDAKKILYFFYEDSAILFHGIGSLCG